MEFLDKLNAAVPDRVGLCVGLDPIMSKLPAVLQGQPEPFYRFNVALIEATAPYASAYKPNLAFYEALGWQGWQQLEKTIQAIPEGKVIIADAKRGDIGSTAKAYAEALFARLGADAATVNPYLGADTLLPYLEHPGKGIYVVCLTSNPGSRDLEERQMEGKALYRKVIALTRGLNAGGRAGLVMGATKPEMWSQMLSDAIDLPLLVPGIGAQGGSAEQLLEALQGYPAKVLVNASRSIIYASSGADFAEAAGEEARKLSVSLGVSTQVAVQ